VQIEKEDIKKEASASFKIIANKNLLYFTPKLLLGHLNEFFYSILGKLVTYTNRSIRKLQNFIIV
jgi:hypothetical protein